MSIFLSEPTYSSTLGTQDVNTRLNALEDEMLITYKTTAPIPANGIANYSVSNTEFQYLNGASSNIQTQINTLNSLVNATPGATTGPISQAEYITLDGIDITKTIQKQLDDINETLGNMSIGNSFVPTGSIFAFGGSGNAPVGFLLCDGSAVSKTTYKNLFAVIGETYIAGNTISNSYFQLPDLRGLFIRGAGTSSSYAYTRYENNNNYFVKGGAVGEFQPQSIESHHHTFREPTADLNVQSMTTNSSTCWDNKVQLKDGGVFPEDSHETRPHNISMNYIIRY